MKRKKQFFQIFKNSLAYNFTNHQGEGLQICYFQKLFLDHSHAFTHLLLTHSFHGYGPFCPKHPFFNIHCCIYLSHLSNFILLSSYPFFYLLSIHPFITVAHCSATYSSFHSSALLQSNQYLIHSLAPIHPFIFAHSLTNPFYSTTLFIQIIPSFIIFLLV